MKFKRTLKAIGYCIINLMLGFINPNSSFAQGIINNGANIVLSTNSKIYIDGSSIATGNYTSQSNGIIVNSAGTIEIFLTGNWVNKALTNTGFSNGNTVSSEGEMRNLVLLSSSVLASGIEY